MLIHDLEKKKLISPPSWLADNTLYLTVMGSICYGVAEDYSDFDVYGYVIPPKSQVFPHLDGEILGFGTQKKRFEQWHEPHIFDKDAQGGAGRNYDFTVTSIVKQFNLAMQGNPNMIDSLFVSQEHILHSTKVSELVRDNRRLFLSKAMWHRFKGYAYSQLHKAKGKNPEKGSKREVLREKYGMDTKYLYHVVRLLGEIEQVLTTGDLDLQERGRREHMKAIRRGEISEQDIRDWFTAKEKQLEDAYHKSTLPWGPDESKIKELLLQCLESHYGNLENCVAETGWQNSALQEIDEVLAKHRSKLYA